VSTSPTEKQKMFHQMIPAYKDSWLARNAGVIQVTILTVIILSMGKIVYFKAGNMIKNDQPVVWSSVFHPSDASFALLSTAVVAIAHLLIAAALRHIIPEHKVAVRYSLLFILSAFLGGLAAIANMAFYYTVLFDYNLPAPMYLFDSAILAFITPITLMATLETFHYRGAWLKEQFATEQSHREVVSAKFDALKNQLSPHFVFNSFNTLGALIGEQPERAQLFLNQLSQVYRYILDNKDKETVSLGRELDSVKALLHVQEARHPDAVKIDFIITEGDRNLRVIPLTLHTLVENVFKHNVLSKKSPIHLRVEAVGRNILVVENNLKPKLDVESHHIGIANLSRRYELLIARGLKILKSAEHFRVEVPFVAPEAQI